MENVKICRVLVLLASVFVSVFGPIGSGVWAAGFTAPVVKTPVIKAPVVKTPVIKPPVVRTPVIKPPVVRTPVIKPPVVRTPVIKPPVVKTPVIKPPVVKTPVIKAPVVKTPVAAPRAVAPPARLSGPVASPATPKVAKPLQHTGRNPGRAVVNKSGIDRNVGRGDQVRDRLNPGNQKNLLKPDSGRVPGIDRKNNSRPEFDTLQGDLAKQKNRGASSKGRHDLDMTAGARGKSGGKAAGTGGRPGGKNSSGRNSLVKDFTGTDPHANPKGTPDTATAGASGSGDPRVGKYKGKTAYQKFKTAVGKVWAKVGGTSKEKKAKTGSGGARGRPNPDGTSGGKSWGQMSSEEKTVFMKSAEVKKQSLINPGSDGSGVSTHSGEPRKKLDGSLKARQAPYINPGSEGGGSGAVGQISGGTGFGSLIDPGSAPDLVSPTGGKSPRGNPDAGGSGGPPAGQ